jgi:hypothetical protein
MIRKLLARFGYVPAQPTLAPANLILFLKGREVLNIPVAEVERLTAENHPVLIRNGGMPFMAIRVQR